MPKVNNIMTVKGLDTSRPAEYLSEKQTPDCQNVEVYRNVLRERSGLSTLGSAESNEIMAGRTFTRADTDYTLRISLRKIEQWNSGTSSWDDKTGSDLTGTTDDPIDTAVPLLSAQRILTFTNNVDNIRKYTGTGNTADLGGSPPKCKFMTEFGSYLVLAHVNDGTVRPMRVQWSDTADPETWSGGNSGSNDLSEDGEEVTGLHVYGDFVSVHKETGIYLMYPVSSSNVFKFDRKNTGTGTVCNATIQNLPTGQQIFLARDGLHLFNGRSAPLIESAEFDDIREGLNSEYIHKCWSCVVKEKDEYWVGVPIGSETTGDTVYKYNYRTGVVYKDTHSNITCAFSYEQTDALTWADISSAWDDYSGRWNDITLTKLFPIILLGDNSGNILKVDSIVWDDNNSAVNAYWETKDYQSDTLGQMIRWSKMNMWAKGSSAEVYYSTDSGETWTLIEDVTLNDNYPSDDAPDELWFDVVTSKIRFRFQNDTSGEGFYLKQFVLTGYQRELR